jgi:hypothetical protein
VDFLAGFGLARGQSITVLSVVPSAGSVVDPLGGYGS